MLVDAIGNDTITIVADFLSHFFDPSGAWMIPNVDATKRDIKLQLGTDSLHRIFESLVVLMWVCRRSASDS
jgi:hypothetical protein